MKVLSLECFTLLALCLMLRSSDVAPKRVHVHLYAPDITVDMGLLFGGGWGGVLAPPGAN